MSKPKNDQVTPLPDIVDLPEVESEEIDELLRSDLRTALERMAGVPAKPETTPDADKDKNPTRKKSA